MSFARKRYAPPEPPPEPAGPAWERLLDPEERPNREDLASSHTPFESILEPVPLPRWLRGRRRVPRDKLS